MICTQLRYHNHSLSILSSVIEYFIIPLLRMSTSSVLTNLAEVNDIRKREFKKYVGMAAI